MFSMRRQIAACLRDTEREIGRLYNILWRIRQGTYTGHETEENALRRVRKLNQDADRMRRWLQHPDGDEIEE